MVSLRCNECDLSIDCNESGGIKFDVLNVKDTTCVLLAMRDVFTLIIEQLCKFVSPTNINEDSHCDACGCVFHAGSPYHIFSHSY